MRTVGIGAIDPAVLHLHEATLTSVAAGESVLRAGAAVSDVAANIEKADGDMDLRPVRSMGHLCGTDLTEERVSTANRRIIAPGTAVILHPGVIDLGSNWRTFWGQTYLCLEGNTERLHAASDEFIIL